uniref:8_1 putative 7.9 kDa secreted protein n=1 Tax=Ixodes pacificus TaxID=29930 RepID=Q6B8C6_IXOPA|nr:8_1 putative 7.9 kDa secreted protein [Ixodes pacificus]
MRFSCILGLLAMCLAAQATGQNCTREWPVLWPPCLLICQHGNWGRHSWPRFTLEHKPNGTSCRRHLGLSSGVCMNGRCVKPVANMTASFPE